MSLILGKVLLIDLSYFCGWAWNHEHMGSTNSALGVINSSRKEVVILGRKQDTGNQKEFEEGNGCI